MAEKWEEKSGEHCSPDSILRFARSFGLRSKARAYQMRVDNPAMHKEVQQKIAATVKKQWEAGYYDNRQTPDSWSTQHLLYTPDGSCSSYREKAHYYHPEGICLCCGAEIDWDCDHKKGSYDCVEVHHVDGDHDNNLLSNLKPLCRSCHRKYHNRRDQFRATITKSFVFDACHYLPYHDAKCRNIHGHTYHMEISVRDIVLRETGMVMDFGKLKQAVNDNVIEKFDHGFINEYLPYPTAELMVIWIWRALSKDVKGLYRIRLWETDGSYVEMTAGPELRDYLQRMETEWYSGAPDDGDLPEDVHLAEATVDYKVSQYIPIKLKGTYTDGLGNTIDLTDKLWTVRLYLKAKRLDNCGAVTDMLKLYSAVYNKYNEQELNVVLTANPAPECLASTICTEINTVLADELCSCYRVDIQEDNGNIASYIWDEEAI